MKTKFPETRWEIHQALVGYVSNPQVVYSGDHGRISYVVSHLEGAPGVFARTPSIHLIARRKDGTEGTVDTLREALAFLQIPYSDEIAETSA